MPKFFDEISPNDQKIGENFYDEIDDFCDKIEDFYDEIRNLHEGSNKIPNEKRSQIKEGNTYDIPLVY